MDRMHLTEVTPVTTRRKPFGAFGALAVVVVAVVGLVGAATLMNIAPANQPAGIGTTTTATPTVQPPPASPAAPVLPVPVDVTVSSTCSSFATGTERSAGDVTQYRGVKLRCVGTASDPRLSGDVIVSLSIDERADGGADIWGTGDSVDADGRWRGSWSGTVDPGYTTHRIIGVYIGTGGYSGLRVRWSQTGDGTAMELRGTLERVDAISPDSEPLLNANRCSTRAYGTGSGPSAPPGSA